MNKILGIDLGTNSIGWALRNPMLIGNQIEKFGVVTFNKGVGSGKTGEYSFAAERTKKRSARRLYQGRKYRLWATLGVLITEGYCPLSLENLNKWRHYSKEEAIKNKNGGRVYPVDDKLFDQWIKLDFDGDNIVDYSSPYHLRMELASSTLDLTKQINRMKLGRAIYHIAQRRGFKSSRKGTEDIKEKEGKEDETVDLQFSEKKKNKEIEKLFIEYPSAKTIGWLFALLEKEGKRIRENLAQHAIRENYKEEIKFIFEKQEIATDHPLYKNLVETQINRNDGAIFYKRPLRSQKGLIGKCTLEPNKYRIPISHPDFEYFRAWAFINNIRYKPFIENTSFQNNPHEAKPVDGSIAQEIFDKLFLRKSKSYFPFTDVIEFVIKKGYKWQFNYSPKTTVSGCPVSARLKDIIGEDYYNVRIPKQPSEKSRKDYYDVFDIWHILFSFEDVESVSEFAEANLHFSGEKLKQFITAWNALPVGYGMLSLNAIRKINNFLKKGLIYTEAVLLANIPAIVGQSQWQIHESNFIEHISDLIDSNRKQKQIISVVNELISKHKNLEQKFGYKDNTYQLDDSDNEEILLTLKDVYGANTWNDISEDKKIEITEIVTACYQAYFRTTGFTRKDINEERFLEVVVRGALYYKSDSGYYRLPKLIETLRDFLILHFDVNEKNLKKLYHPSEINIYPHSKPDKDGIIKLGSPKTGSFKNPMAMRTLHELRKLINYLIETQQIDNDSRIVVEVARELNDANKRWAIETWQRQREAENAEFAIVINELAKKQNIDANIANENEIDKVRLWYEQNNEESVPPITELKKEVKGIRWTENKKDSYKQIAAQKTEIDKYRLWIEQECQCIYTGKIISLEDLFNSNVTDFEHTIPRSMSFDNSLANQTICFHNYNRTIKKKKIPTQLDNYDKDFGLYSAILPRLDKWKDKVQRIRQQIDFWKTKSKKASTKEYKDDAIRQRHLWQMELQYWQNKLDRFTMTEVTIGFKNSQKVDTQLISKYAFHYLKSYFEKVDVQKGSITAEFRKIFQLQVPDEKKDRNKHSHHAKDASVLTLIPVAAKRDEILKEYYIHQENKMPYNNIPYQGFKREFVSNIDDSILINNITNNQTLTPAKRKIRKRGVVQLLPNTNSPMLAKGDCIRGQLHQDTFYGAIKPAQIGENGNLLKDENGRFKQVEKEKFVLRVPFQYKKDANTPGFKTLEEIKTKIVDVGLKKQIEKQVVAIGSLKDAFEKGIYMLDKDGNPHGNKIRHIRVWASIAEPLKIKRHTYLSDAEYKQHYYAANATNSYFALYIGNGKKDFDFRNLLETAEFLSEYNVKDPKELFEPSITIKKGKNESILPLTYVIESGKKVIFRKEIEENIETISPKELSHRLYVFTNFEKDGRLNFKYHLEARNKIEETYNEAELDFNNPKPTLRFSYAKYDFLVEGYDFKVNMDGTIKWLLKH